MSKKIDDKYRQAYLSNLKLTVELQDKQLQASKLYRRTGESSTIQTDFRTVDEKLNDILQIKINVRKILGDITDAATANDISQKLNNKQAIFYYQQYILINKLIKSKFSQGIGSETFLSYLSKYMISEIANQSFSDNLQQGTLKSQIYNLQNLYQSIAQKQDYNKLNDAYDGSTIDINEYINRAIDSIPPSDFLLSSIDEIENQITKNEVIILINSYLKDLPQKIDISKFITNVERLRAINTGVNNLLEYTESNIIPSIVPSNDTLIQKESIIKIFTDEQIKITKNKMSESTEVIDPIEIGSPMVVKGKVEKQDIGIILDRINNFDDILNLNKEERRTLYDYIEIAHPSELIGKTGLLMMGKKMIREQKLNEQKRDLLALPDTNKEQITNYIIEAKNKYMGSSKLENITQKMKGSGIKIHRDTKEGINKTKRYTSIGRYIINNHKLDKNIVYIVRPSGTRIKSLEPSSTSFNVSSIIKKIINNSEISDSDMESLTNEEKEYIYNVSKETQIENRLSIRPPMMNDEDKEHNRFILLKGEISVGNDNRELIKEFRLLILKLSKQNRLPRNQVLEILEDLTAMGY